MPARPSPDHRARRVVVPPSLGRLDADDAFIGLFIAAMDANGHIAPVEAVRAHHLIWSTNRFRHQSARQVGRHIERMRLLVGEHGARSVMRAAAAAMPARLRPSAFALAADLLLADGTIDRGERRFLDRLTAELGLDADVAQALTAAMLTKNQA